MIFLLQYEVFWKKKHPVGICAAGHLGVKKKKKNLWNYHLKLLLYKIAQSDISTRNWQ